MNTPRRRVFQGLRSNAMVRFWAHIRVKARPVALALAAVWLSSGAYAQTPTTDPAAQDAHAQDILKTCFECHGPGGVSTLPTRPTIAGQNAPYVARQLELFKRAAAAHAQSGLPSGSLSGDVDADAALPIRSDPIMEHMAEQLDAAMIRRVADAVSKLSCDGEKPPAQAATQTPPIPPAGQRCTACHGTDGIAQTPNVPNLAGQRRAYLRRQLLLIRETAWGAEPRENESWRSHPIMEREAARISIEDVDTLAYYYAGLNCHGTPKP